MNGNTKTNTRDIGKDATTGYLSGNTNAHAYTGLDKAGFTLNYYDGDYNDIKNGVIQSLFCFNIGAGLAFL